MFAWLLPAIILFMSGSEVCSAQSSGPAKIVTEIAILHEEVVTEQWPVMLETVHAPREPKYLEPGQCIRFGVFALGNGRRELLQKSTYAFDISLAGNHQSFSPEPPQTVKLTTLFMPEFLAQTLGKGRVFKEIPPDQALAASGPKTRWCVPVDAQDETASVQGSVLLADGKTLALKHRKLEIKTFESARKKSPFNNTNQVGDWLQHFHDTPDPALLLPALRLIAQDGTARNATNLMEFFVAAFKAHPVAAEELQRRLPAEDRWTRLIGTAVLGWAGYETASLRAVLPQEDKNALAAVSLPRPIRYNSQREDRCPAGHAVGHFLCYGTDAAGSSHQHGAGLERRLHQADGTRPSDARFREKSPLVSGRLTQRALPHTAQPVGRWARWLHPTHWLSDYIEALKAAPDTQPSVKQELENLYKNPAFRMDQAAGPPK